MMRRLYLFLVLGLCALLPGSAQAGDNARILLEFAPVEMIVVDGDLWEVNTGTGASWDLFALKSTATVSGDVSIQYSIFAECPDIDERITGIEHGESGKTTKSGFGGAHFTDDSRSRWVNGTVRITAEDLRTQNTSVQFVLKVWCKPLVGTSDLTNILKNVQFDAKFDPSTISARSEAILYNHSCPYGYELVHTDDEPGYAPTSMELTRGWATCRSGHLGDPKPKEKSGSELGAEIYQQKLTQAGEALAVLQAAGIQTIYDLAKTHPNNVTSVLGIQKGKKVHAAAKAQLAAGKLLDPNWRFDRYFIMDPTWIVDPRIKGTGGAAKKMAKGQAELVKLQKQGIVTLFDLASAKESTLEAILGDRARAKELRVAAKFKQAATTADSGSPGVTRDWVIHPAWMIDPAYLPSVEIVRYQPYPPPKSGGEVTVTAHTPGRANVPPVVPANTKAKVDQKAAKKARTIKKGDMRSPAWVARDSGTQVTVEAKTPRREARSEQRGSGQRGGSQRGDIPPSGEGSRGEGGRKATRGDRRKDRRTRKRNRKKKSRGD